MPVAQIAVVEPLLVKGLGAVQRVKRGRFLQQGLGSAPAAQLGGSQKTGLLVSFARVASTPSTHRWHARIVLRDNLPQQAHLLVLLAQLDGRLNKGTLSVRLVSLAQLQPRAQQVAQSAPQAHTQRAKLGVAHLASQAKLPRLKPPCAIHVPREHSPLKVRASAHLAQLDKLLTSEPLHAQIARLEDSRRTVRSASNVLQAGPPRRNLRLAQCALQEGPLELAA